MGTCPAIFQDQLLLYSFHIAGSNGMRNIAFRIHVDATGVQVAHVHFICVCVAVAVAVAV